MDGRQYNFFSRSWALFSRQSGWWKVLLVMALALFVPIVGPLGAMGYALEWARLTAWGADTAPRQKNVKVGACIKSGWRGLLGCIGWYVIWIALSAWLRRVSSDDGLVSLALYLLGLLVEVLMTVCALRATVYQKASAGYQANRIWDMLKDDFEGIARITIMGFLIDLVLSVVMFFLAAIVIAPQVVYLITSGVIGAYSSDASVVRAILHLLANMIPSVLALVYVFVVGYSFRQLMVTTAVGLWMRNFNVPAWGASGDPLPPKSPTLPGAGNVGGSYAGGQYGNPNVNSYASQQPEQPTAIVRYDPQQAQDEKDVPTDTASDH